MLRWHSFWSFKAYSDIFQIVHLHAIQVLIYHIYTPYMDSLGEGSALISQSMSPSMFPFPCFFFPSADGPRSFGCFFDVQWQEIGPSQHQALTIPERSGDPRWFQGPQPPNPFRCYGPIWVRIGGTMHSIHFFYGFFYFHPMKKLSFSLELAAGCLVYSILINIDPSNTSTNKE